MGLIDKFFRERGFKRDLRHVDLYRVFRNVEPDDVPNPWTRKLLQLSDGRPVLEIAQTLSRDHQMWGPLASELGPQSPLLHRSILESLAGMASLGLVRLEPMEPMSQPTPCR